MKRPTRNNRPRKSAKKRAVKPSPQKKRTTFVGKFEYGQCEPRILLSANEPPVNSVPGDQTTQVNTPIAFTAYRENLVSTSDADAGLNPVRVTLTAEHGHITLLNPDPGGLLTYSEGDGFEDVTMTFTGRLDTINTALQWVSFQPDADYLGTATMTITTNDQGYFGTGGPQEDIDSINIEVTEVPAFDPPPTWTTFPGALDTSFDEDGMKTLPPSDDGISYIHDMRELDDGKIVAVGSIGNRCAVMRFNSDMTLDSTFGNGGYTDQPGINDQPYGHAYTFEIDKQDRLVVGLAGHIARFSSEGVLDETFGTDGFVPNDFVSDIYSLEFQADGKLLAFGGNNKPGFRVNRFLEDGTWDADFGDREYQWRRGDQEYGRGIIARDNGDILMLGRGQSNHPNPIDDVFLGFRIDSQGNQELEDFRDVTNSAFVNSTLTLPDGKVLMIGHDGENARDLVVTRRHFDGQQDDTFGVNGILSIPVLNDSDNGYRAALQADGKILITGNSYNGANSDLIVVRTSYDGELDTDFNGNGTLQIPFSSDHEFGYSILSLSDGKILVAGRSGDDIALVRLLGDSDQSDTSIVLENLPRTTLVNSFGDGSGTAYFGQSFIAPSNVAKELTFSLRHWDFPNVSGLPGTAFRLLITEITSNSPTGGSPLGVPFSTVRPTSVLFESADLLLQDGADWTDFTIDLGDLSLTGGEKYAFVLDAHVLDDGVPSSRASAGTTGSRDVDTYPDGEFFFGYLFGDSDIAKSRQDILDGEKNWFMLSDGDHREFAFRMSFDDTSRANDPPVNVVPGDQTTVVNTPIAFTAYRENLVSTSDADAGLNPVRVTLTAEHGHITLLNPDPDGLLTYSEGDGFEDVTMTFTGRLDTINTALQWVSFQPDADYLGTATMTITTNDQGYFGTGGPQEDIDSINIEVTEVPAFDPPPTWTTFPGALDTSFDEDGMKTLPPSDDGISYIHDMRELDDGKIVAVGSIGNRCAVMRFNSDMTLDSTFGNGGYTDQPGINDQPYGHAYTFEIDKQDRLVVGLAGHIARFSSEGVLDETFGTDGFVPNDFVSDIYSLEFQADGKLLAFGGNNKPGFRVNRFLEDGTWDADFGDREYQWRRGDQEYGRGIIARDNGDILMLGRGQSNHPNPIDDVFLGFRIDSQGNQELEDFRDVTNSAFVNSTLTLPDGKVLMIGHDGENARDLVVTRRHFDGQQDDTFGVNGILSIPVLNDSDNGYRAALQADGKILITGNSYNGANSDLIVVRTSYDGVLDTDFNGNGKLQIPFSGNDENGYSILSLADGKILIAGKSGNDIALVRLYGDYDIFGQTTNDPTLDPITDLAVIQDSGETSVPLSGISDGDDGDEPLAVTVEADQPGLFFELTVDYQSPNPTGTIRFTPATGQFGQTNVTVTVEDGGEDLDLATTEDNKTYSRTFTVKVKQIVDVGDVDYFLDSDRLTENEEWYQGTAMLDGYLSLETVFDSADGEIQIELLDDQKNWVASGSATETGQRIDYSATAGEQFYLRILGDNSSVDVRMLNLVSESESGTLVSVGGTVQADDYTFMASPAAATPYRLIVHRFDYQFSRPASSDIEFQFDGKTGADSIWLSGTSGAETAILRLDDTRLTGTGYAVQGLNIEDVVFVGRGGADTATFYDTNTADTFSSSPNWAKMVGSSYSHIVRGLPTVTAHATLGYDLAYMGDSDGNDTYETFSDRVVMTSDTHVATAIGFKRSSGTSTGGNDTATSHDSAGNDRLLSYDDRIILFDGTHTHTSIDFTINEVFASGQAGDVAYMFDSAGADQMVARPGSTVITQSDRQTTAQGFAQSFGYASTGHDTAEFYDTAGNNDYNGYMDRAVMKGDGIFLWGRGFDQMAGYFSSGSDRALMFDSEADEQYVSGANDTTMSNESATNRVVGYSSIYAYSESGTDTATLHDTAGQETFRAYPDKAVLHGDDMFSWTRGFSQVTAHSSGGTDEAQFFDSAGDDTFRSEGATSQMSGDGYLNLAQGFLKNSGYSSGGTDTALMFDTSGDDQYRAYSNRAVMIGSGITNTAYDFGNTQGFSNTGTDSARLFDSAGDDLLMSYADRATLSGDGWANEVVGFYLNTVYGSSGYDQATMEDSTGDDLVKVRANGPRLTQGDGTVFDVRTFDRILARSVNGGEDIAELLDVDYEFELEGDWNS